MRMKQEDPPKGQEPPLTILFEWFGAFLYALALLVLMFTFAARIVGVQGSSMQPTLWDNDFILLTGAMLYTPKPGDIVVVRKETYRSDPIIKRVVAVAGQTVNIDFSDGTVYVDGMPLHEPYVNAPTYLRYDVLFPVTVEEGCVFLLGDNRNESTDSRFSAIGQVDARLILGKVQGVFYPLSHFGGIENGAFDPMVSRAYDENPPPDGGGPETR